MMEKSYLFNGELIEINIIEESIPQKTLSERGSLLLINLSYKT